jgi:hypothetical protein
MLRRVDLVRTDVPDKRSATLTMGALRSSETSVLTRVTRRNIQKDGILHGHRRENLKSYIGQNHINNLSNI